MTELTIFFDGGCPLCVAEIGHLERLDSANKIAFEDIYAPSLSERFPQVDVKKLTLFCMDSGLMAASFMV